MQIHRTASFLILFAYLLSSKPMYNTILRLTLVRYDLAVILVRYDLAVILVRYDLAVILVRYDLAVILVRYNLETESCMISISEPPLLRYLVLGELRSPLT